MFWRRRKESAAPNYQPFHTAPNVTQIDRFIALTLASGLVSFSELQKACADFDTSRQDVEAVDDLCRLLVGTRVLTPWQCGKLRQGKYKGFIEGGFRFRTFVNKDDDNNWTMIADRLSDGERVAVKVIRLKAAPWIQYSIAENIDPTYIID